MRTTVTETQSCSIRCHQWRWQPIVKLCLALLLAINFSTQDLPDTAAYQSAYDSGVCFREPLYCLVTDLSAMVSIKFHWFYVVFVALTLYVYLSVVKAPAYILLSGLSALFMPEIFGSQIRWALAGAIFLYSISNQKKLSVGLVALFLCFLHTGALVFGAFLFLRRCSANTIFCCALFAAIFLYYGELLLTEPVVKALFLQASLFFAKGYEGAAPYLDPISVLGVVWSATLLCLLSISRGVVSSHKDSSVVSSPSYVYAALLKLVCILAACVIVFADVAVVAGRCVKLIHLATPALLYLHFLNLRLGRKKISTAVMAMLGLAFLFK